MLRLLTALAVLALLALAACPGKRPAVPSAQPPPGRPSVAGSSAAGGATEAAKSIPTDALPEEVRAPLTEEIRAEAKRRGYQLSDDGNLVFGIPMAPPRGVEVLVLAFEVYQSSQQSTDYARAVQDYFDGREKALEEQQQADKEKLAGAARIEKGEIIGPLQIVNDPIGDWRSIGETREGEKHFLVEHDAKYYKLMTLNVKGGMARFIEYNDGEPKSKNELPYKYDNTTGQLTTTGAGGGQGEGFIMMQLADYPEYMFVRPLYETVFSFTVYKKEGNADKALDTGAVEAPPAPPKK
jgi:hypothetical protein